ncbi:MAG TPA: sugar ABC transporter permease [Chloroflexaceae bacterium]|nr:sugar ABC transporter permease [Chloroflexaceae bacterium]
MTATEFPTAAAPHMRRRPRADLVPGILMVAPAVFFLLLFLIGPFLLGIGFSFTNQRLISANPTEFVGVRNYSRLLRLAVLPLQPLADEATGRPQRDEAGNLQYPRTREFTRDAEQYPQYAGLREWVSLDVGATRYVLLAGDPVFLRSLLNILYFAVVVVPVQSGLALALALLINRKLRGVNFFRTLYFSPVVTSMVVISIVWTFIYDKNVGLMNQIVGALTFGQVGPLDWLGDERLAMPSIMLMSVWQGVGFQMVLFLAGLQSIPEPHYEAASIDGANAWQQFRYITVPGLRNVMVFILITITIAAFQLFTQPFVMTNGGPNNATSTVAFHMVREGFREQDIAYASTIAVVFFLLILTVSLIQRYLTRDKEA